MYALDHKNACIEVVLAGSQKVEIECKMACAAATDTKSKPFQRHETLGKHCVRHTHPGSRLISPVTHS
jgi:hypothetical protein